MATYYGSPNNNAPKKEDTPEWVSWMLIGLCFMGGVWPIGLIWLLLKLFGDDKKKTAKAPPLKQTNNYMNQEQVEPQPTRAQTAYRSMTKTPNDKKSTRTWLLIVGIILAVIGVTAFADALETLSLTGFMDYADAFFSVGLMSGGAAMIGGFIGKKKASERYGRYSVVIGNAQAVHIATLAKITGYKETQVRKDLQQMINNGQFGATAYINDELGYLFTSSQADEQLRARREAAAQRSAEDLRRAAEEEKARREAENLSMYDTILHNIRDVNDRIKSPVMSEKIDRIEHITRLIFRAVEKEPEKANKIDRFLNYYLPTTLKLLESYAKLEKTGTSGENVQESMHSVEDAMDSIETGFKNLLDDLYKADVIDIKSDIEVMKQMLGSDAAAASKDFDLSKAASAEPVFVDTRSQFEKDFGIYPEGWTGPRPETAQSGKTAAASAGSSAVSYGGTAAAVQEQQ